jgi:hypothetical protein
MHDSVIRIEDHVHTAAMDPEVITGRFIRREVKRFKKGVKIEVIVTLHIKALGAFNEFDCPAHP